MEIMEPGIDGVGGESYRPARRGRFNGVVAGEG